MLSSSPGTEESDVATAVRMRARWVLLLAAVAALVLPAIAATLKPGFTEVIIASGLSDPTAMAFTPDGRLFVCKQSGQLRVIENNQLLPTPFVSLTVNSSGERGLLGVAFDPNFPINQFVYVYYTATSPTIHNRVSRFTANGNVAVAGSEFVLLDLPALSATNHNGGAMHFGLDGKLYIAVGDNAVGSNSQTLANPLGKMLRVNSNGTSPSDNPFFSQTTGINQAIWALGLRNPFTFSIQPTSGRMFINDVGQNTWEEINEGAAGANYGWPTTEGATTNPAFVTPVYSYSHGTGPFQGCAITGGAFYAGLPAQFPSEYVGDYFFAEYCTGWINQLDSSSGVVVNTFASGISSPVDLAVGPEGSLYYLARGSSGVVVRIDFTGSQAPAITQHPANRTVSVGQSASFTVGASGAPPLSYQWQRGGTPISGATSATYVLPTTTLSDNGAQFRAVVTNASGTATSNTAALTVVTNQPPLPTIITPAPGALYSAGTTLAYSGSATDPEDGAVPAQRFTWRIDFHHDAHTHPFVAPVSGSTSGSALIPAVGHTETTVWYRVHLTVSDSAGLTATTFRDVQPRKVNLTLAANPSGAALTLDGQPVTAPYTFPSVVGVRRIIGAISPITVGNKTLDFASWSDGGAQTHTITTPATNQTITATYKRRKGRG
jgi:glucose/arabinose dehydrogenase